MLGSTFELPLVLGGVPSPIDLVKINQDGYSSEYLYRTETAEYRLKIRHTATKETPTKPAYERHNIECVVTVFATPEVAQYYQKFYAVLEQKPGYAFLTMPEAVCNALTADSNALLTAMTGWES